MYCLLDFIFCIAGVDSMKEESYKIIKEMYDDLKKEYVEQLSNLEFKKSKILEIDTFLESIFNEEQNDLHVFTPKKTEDVFQSIVDQKRKEKEKIVSECDEIDLLSHKNKKRLDQLEQIMSDDSFLLHMKQFSVLEIQEKERQRIARDLHDSSLQILTHLVHKAELTSLYIDQDSIKAKLELATIEKNLRKVIEDIRNNIFDLRPMSFEDLGLKETIEKMLILLNQDKQFKIVTDIENIKFNISCSKKDIFLITIYRIIQECVQNSIKHSKGDEIRVSLKDKKKYYEIIIFDNGIGFDINEAAKKDKHFGLSVIKERVFLLNGRITINTQNQNGCLIKIEIPQLMEDVE